MKLKSINYKIKTVKKRTKIVSTAPVRPDIYLSNFWMGWCFGNDFGFVFCLRKRNDCEKILNIWWNIAITSDLRDCTTITCRPKKCFCNIDAEHMMHR